MRGDGTRYLYVTTLIEMPRPDWIHNDAGYIHISGNKNKNPFIPSSDVFYNAGTFKGEKKSLERK